MSRRILVASVALVGALGVGTVTAQSASAARAVPLTIRTNHTSYLAGQSATVSIHLGVPGGKQYLNIFRTIVGKPADYVTTVQGDVNGNAAVTIPVAYNESFTASYGGSDDGTSYYPATVTSPVVKVAVQIDSELSGSYGTSGAYHLIHNGKKGTLDAAVAPRKTGEKLTFVLQANIRGAWRTELRHAYSMHTANDTVSEAGATFQYPRRVHCRIRAQYAGDSTNTGHNTAWTYVEFI